MFHVLDDLTLIHPYFGHKPGDQLPKQLYRYNTVCIYVYAFRQHVPTTNRLISHRAIPCHMGSLVCLGSTTTTTQLVLFAQGFLKWHKPPKIQPILFCLWNSRGSDRKILLRGSRYESWVTSAPLLVTPKKIGFCGMMFFFNGETFATWMMRGFLSII